MSRAVLAVILAALASGCASSPEQSESVGKFLNGMAAGAVIGAAMRPQPVYVQPMPSQTSCRRYGNRVECWSY